MDVGKTTISQQLKKDLPNSVFLDGDGCQDSNPFQVIEETKTMILRNICFLQNRFLYFKYGSITCIYNLYFIKCWDVLFSIRYSKAFTYLQKISNERNA